MYFFRTIPSRSATTCLRKKLSEGPAGTGPLAALIVLFLAGCGGATSDPPQLTADRFDASAAYRLVERQVAAGTRPAGSPQLRRLAVELRRLIPGARFEPLPGEPGLRNIVATLPGARPGVVVGAHYDTLDRPRGYVGANNGAAGTAVVIGVARALAAAPRPPAAREVRFVLFDGEQPPDGLPGDSPDFYEEGLRGSRAYVEAHPGSTAQMVLLDYVGNRDLRLPREATSSEPLWSRVLRAAEAVGASSHFSAATGAPITDDHTPFLLSGAEAVDLIDWSHPGHDLRDNLARIDPASLDAVGETVIQLVDELR